jgi:rhodanese-related sulfurtransferase
MIKSMTVQELKTKLDSKANIVLIDCRELEEWNEGHIKGAQFLALSSFGENYPSILNDKNAEIVCQCRSGKRSLSACMLLQDEGFENLSNLEGGILAWAEAGFGVEA